MNPEDKEKSSYLSDFIDDDELKYMSLIQNQIRPFFPNFAAAISKQSPAQREQGRCAVVEFDKACDPQSTSFEHCVELRQYLLDSPFATPDSETQTKRRLFILEDLPCNHILALGSRLRIPPSFFGGHYDDPASSAFNHRNPFLRHTKSGFRLRYADSHRAEVDVPSHMATCIYAYNTNTCRYIHAYDPKSIIYDEVRTHHILSFWSSPVRPDGSWDAVLLVDPPLEGSVRCLPSMQLAPLRNGLKDEESMLKHYLHPEMTELSELPEEPSEWATSYELPQHNSLFDDTLEMLTSQSNHREPVDCSDPLATVAIPRKLVCGTFLAFLRRRYLNLLRIQRNHLKPNQTLRNNYLSSFSDSSLSSWHDEFFNFVVGSCAAMKEMIREIEDDVVSLGLHTGAGPPPTSRGVDGTDPPAWEVDGWRSVQDLARGLDHLTASLATVYMQYITIREARVSNGNAQSLSRITVSTMLFIPLSTVASIFSMGDDFLPGSARAWVFWVVSIPLLAVLAYLHWRQWVVEKFRRSKQSLLPLFEEK